MAGEVRDDPNDSTDDHNEIITTWARLEAQEIVFDALNTFAGVDQDRRNAMMGILIAVFNQGKVAVLLEMKETTRPQVRH